jgi:CRISPR-associated protein Csm5
MNAPLKNYFPLMVEPLTPVAVGSGSVMDPLRYTMLEKDGDVHYHLLDLEGWVLAHLEDAQLMQKLGTENYRELRSILQQRFTGENDTDLKRFSRGSFLVPKESPAWQHFTRELENRGGNRAFEVDAALRNPVTQRLILPGSSLKGAIRTAVLDYLDQSRQLKLTTKMPRRRDGRNWDDRAFDKVLTDLLGNISDNDFRALQLNDFEFLAEDCLVVKPVEVPRNPEAAQKNRTPKNACECIGGLIVTGRKVSACSSAGLGRVLLKKQGTLEKLPGTLRIQDRSNRGRDEDLDWKALCKIVSDFYKKRFEDEIQKFYRQPHLQHVERELQKVQERLRGINPEKEMLLRIGHYSHIESMTLTEVDPEQQITVRGGVRYSPGTTRTLAENRFPFGWVVLRVCDPEELGNYRERLQQDWQKRREEQNQMQLQQQAKDEERRKQLLAKQQVELEQKEKEIQIAKAEAAKPAGERLIEAVDSLQDWGQIMQFASSKLEALDPKEYVPELGEALRNQVKVKGVTKKGIKKDPQLGEKRMSKMDEWLNRFESS